MVRVTGSDQSAVTAQVDQEYTEDQQIEIIPARIVNMHRLPRLGIVLAGALGTMTLACVIVAGARIHRRELAVLRALRLDAKPLRRALDDASSPVGPPNHRSADQGAPGGVQS